MSARRRPYAPAEGRPRMAREGTHPRMDESTHPQLFRSAVRRRWPVVVIALLLGLAAGASSVVASTPVYQATSVIFLDPLVGNPYSPSTPNGRQEELAALTTEAGLLLADAVARAAAEEAKDAGIDLGPRIQEHTSTEVPSNSQVIYVSFRSGNPQAAQVGAQALATAYLEYRQLRSEDVVDAQLSRIDEEISSLSALVDSTSQTLDTLRPKSSDDAASEVESLQEQLRIYANQLAQLRIERASTEGSGEASPGRIVSPSREPQSPEGIPAPYIGAAIALVLLGLGLVLAVVLEHLDTRLRGADDVKRLGISPAVGPTPVWRPWLDSDQVQDTYRLAAIRHERGIHAMLGADCPVPEGVAAGLAHELSELGRSVIVVLTESEDDAELHEGLSDLLRAPTQHAAGYLHDVQPGLRVLGPGLHPDELPGLLPGPGFEAILRSLADQSDAVIVVGGPAPSAAAATMARAVDSTTIVCLAGRTREADLLSASGLVQESAGRVGSVLLVDAAPRRHRRAHRASDGNNVTTLLRSRAPATPTSVQDLTSGSSQPDLRVPRQ